MNLAHYRIKAGLTQEELAELCGCSQGAIGHYEKGKRSPNAARIESIISALRKTGIEVSFEDLVSVSSNECAA